MKNTLALLDAFLTGGAVIGGLFAAVLNVWSATLTRPDQDVWQGRFAVFVANIDLSKWGRLPELVITAGMRLLLAIVGLGVVSQAPSHVVRRSLLFVPLVFAGAITLDNVFGATSVLLPFRWALPGLCVTALVAIALLVAGRTKTISAESAVAQTSSDVPMNDLEAIGTVILFFAGMATGIYWIMLSVRLPIAVVGLASILVVPFCSIYLMFVLNLAGFYISSIVDVGVFIVRGRSLQLLSEDLMSSGFLFELSSCAGFFLASSPIKGDVKLKTLLPSETPEIFSGIQPPATLLTPRP